MLLCSYKYITLNKVKDIAVTKLIFSLTLVNKSLLLVYIYFDSSSNPTHITITFLSEINNNINNNNAMIN